MKKKIEKAKERFEQMGIKSSIDEGSLFIKVLNTSNDRNTEVEVSKEEISFRAWEFDIKKRMESKNES